MYGRMQNFTIVWAGTWFLQFYEQVPDGHSGPVCGYGLQPSLLPPRSHLQVNQSDLLLLFYKSLSGTSLPYPGCGVSTKSLIEGSFFAPALCLSFTIFVIVQVPKEPEVLFHRPPHQLHQSRLQLLQAHHQCQVWEEDPVSFSKTIAKNSE